MAAILKHKKPWDKITPKDYNELVDAIKILEKFKIAGKGISMSSGPLGRTVSLNLDTATGQIQRAVTQDPYQPDPGEISVKLINDDDTEISDAFIAYAWPSGAAVDVDDNYLPKLAIGVAILVTKVNGTWYMIWPTLTDVGDKDDTPSSTSPNIGGRFLEEWVDQW